MVAKQLVIQMAIDLVPKERSKNWNNQPSQKPQPPRLTTIGTLVSSMRSSNTRITGTISKCNNPKGITNSELIYLPCLHPSALNFYRQNSFTCLRSISCCLTMLQLPTLAKMETENPENPPSIDCLPIKNADFKLPGEFSTD